MALQRRVDGPAGVTALHFKHVCELACTMEAAASTPESRLAWERSNVAILDHLVAAVRRDPGRRVLVAVQCRRLHYLEQRLRGWRDEIDVAAFGQL
jgi:hypothetical protein